MLEKNSNLISEPPLLWQFYWLFRQIVRQDFDMFQNELVGERILRRLQGRTLQYGSSKEDVGRLWQLD